MFTVTTLDVTAAVQVIATIAGFVFVHKVGWIKSAEKALASVAPEIAAGINTGEKALNTVLHSPEVAGLKTEAENLKNQLEDTRVVQIAGTVIHAFSKSLDTLTEDELSTASLIIKTEAQRLGITVNTNQVLDALKKVQHVADLVASSSLFKATQNVVAEKQAVKATVAAPVEQSTPQAPASTTPPSEPTAPPSDVGADPAQTTQK